MGSQLSVYETAYKQLDRELKSQNGDYVSSITTFLQNCKDLDVSLSMEMMKCRGPNHMNN